MRKPARARYRAVRTQARSHDLAHLLHLLSTVQLVAPVDSVFELQGVADAHARADSGATGKVVLRL